MTENRESARASIAVWDDVAPFWDEHIGPDGNRFHRMLVGPTSERLLDIQPGEHVLDIACGNGQFARRMAELGARVLAFDGSAAFIERARGHGVPERGGIEYHIADATDGEWLLALGENRFDAAVCTMALMDIADLEPLAFTLPFVLKPGARFVWSVSHPCYNSVGSSMIAEQQDRAGEMVTTFSIKTAGYLQPKTQRGIGIVGQPAPHYYFHRPISLLINTFLQAGFVLDGIEEPSYPRGLDHHRLLSWSDFPDIPPLLVVRMRL